MPVVPVGFVHQTQLGNQIAKVVRKLGREAVHVNYSLGADSTGEPSIFFRIVLTDAASREEKLAEVTSRIATTLFDELHPHENWGRQCLPAGNSINTGYLGKGLDKIFGLCHCQMDASARSR